MRLDTMTLEQKVASMFIVRAPGLDGAAWQATVSRGLGGLILMGENIPATPEELAALTGGVSSGDGLSPLIAIDEEGGDVTRLPYDGFAGADSLAAEPESATLDAFTGRSTLLGSVGVSVNFGVVADVTADPASFIFSRTLGPDAATAAPKVAAAVAGEKGRVFSTLKHFPGHGESTDDSHTSVPQIDVDLGGWRARDAPPFKAGIDGGAELVMFGHLAYTPVDPQPASLSSTWHSILRDELGFTGVTVTDDMGMLEATGLPEYANPDENAIRAVAAGNDLLLYVTPGDIDATISAVVGAVESGRIDSAVIDDAVTRDLELRRTLWLRQHPDTAF
ncbi:glycoside hydrolase family 3 protein [Agreia pratensis]|uniref:glycoside hydrolase family 3 N-terminal domain-containing protein n=1 Tax=Agreia pratensis TaxID=150121 RepID=UPI00188A2107|nr:glycoside hydrolase family 3 N-terminal domain-containing protein [Agreia pratensis]MBF4634820.1 glycoside hydrolase family 3 protein [Agreia pratensis]